jgi:putative phosphoesterase
LAATTERALRTVGLISDTHGLLRPEATRALEGSDLILHAGDVGSLDLLRQLGEIAPVRAVRGNTDPAEVVAAMPETDVVDLTSPNGAVSREGRGPLAYLLHGHREIDLDPAASGFRVVVFGHSHQPLVQERDGVLFVNPGSAGPRRFGLPVSVARLSVEGGEVIAEIIELDVS